VTSAVDESTLNAFTDACRLNSGLRKDLDWVYYEESVLLYVYVDDGYYDVGYRYLSMLSVLPSLIRALVERFRY